MKTSSYGDTYLLNGVFVHVATNELSRDGATIHLEPKSMEVLVHLIRNAGQVLSREAIQNEIWDDVIVGDDSLTNAIIKIRKAFGDDARNPQVIETIPKRGYRLIADVEVITDAASGSKPRVRNFILAGVMAALVAGLVFAFVQFWWPGKELADAVPVVPAIATDKNSVRVVPFVNLGGDPAQDYLVRGIEETIVTGLSGIAKIRVLHAAAGTETGRADFRLEGNVSFDDATLSIAVRLADEASGEILASEQFAGGFADLRKVETGIGKAVIRALALDIDKASLAALSRGYTNSIDAYDLFLRARQALLPRTKAGNGQAQALYKRAISRDPQFARAYAGLALSYAADYRNGWTDDGAASLDKALRMARTALEIEPNLPEQYWVIGYVRTQQRAFEQAETALNQALQLDPSYADAYALLGGISTYRGQPEQTIPLLRKAMQLRPQAGYLYFLLLGRAYYFLGDCELAEVNIQEALSRNPENDEAHLYHAACLVRQGQQDDAEWEIDEIHSRHQELSGDEFFATYPLVDAKELKMLRGDLATAGFK